ncbi:alcohol dehydrogenase catalytic domain-containing protein [Secundilactobacillus hailunensis]|uniref:Alcohol dehydrogenase catalytic domain-containing protein n=1 Tax=Secundilactobacillus hailunensis TaxID=2559923 RepID=A0ABW1T5Z2_9LACO|nr:zinc-binding alcohol dehydrogenase family protein [Secundilactobacillus hailunensis]
MLAIMQTNFNGIDDLTAQSVSKPKLTADSVIVKMNTVPVSPTDWKLESDQHATNENLAQLPRIIGIQGAGLVVEVGENRDQHLLNQRVLVINPAGTYSEYVRSTNPDWLFPLPDAVSNEAAAALSASTALTLKKFIDSSDADNLILTGANSVIGLTLLQLLHGESKPIYPVVTAESLAYFNTQMPNLTAYTSDQLPKLTGKTLILDTVGIVGLLETLVTHTTNASVTSIVIMKDPGLPNFKFIHDDFNADDYRLFIQQLATGELKPLINRTFPIAETKKAQHFAKETHSRGRVLVAF